MTTHDELVKYTFTRDELVVIAKDQARHMSERTRLEEQFDNVKAEHKSAMTRKDADVADCTRRITSGYEMRSVKCLVLKFRPDADHALVIRTDNGRVLRTRKLDSDEKQLDLTAEKDEFIFTADFYHDTDSDIAEVAAEGVPLTKKEAELLKDHVSLEPMRKMLESAPDRPKKKK